MVEDEKESIVKPKKTGFALTVLGAFWMLRSLVFMVPDIYKIALIIGIIISIIGGIMVIKGKEPGSLISLIGGIVNPILIILIVYNPAFWFYDFWYRLLNLFMFMFLDIYGFAIYGISFLLLLIGGILSFKKL
ncbi:MAG: hypothetical protein ACTSP9_10525 [Promethearchaeota archaeon]